MPIEIKELHIKAVVSAKEREPAGVMKPEQIHKLKKELTRDIMEKVLKMLRQKNER